MSLIFLESEGGEDWLRLVRSSVIIVRAFIQKVLEKITMRQVVLESQDVGFLEMSGSFVGKVELLKPSLTT